MKNDNWMPNGSDSVANCEMSHEPSTGISQKRSHQMSMDASKQELFFNKKQAVESVNSGPTSKAAILNDPLWRDVSSYHPGGKIGDGLFIPKPVRISNVSYKNSPSIDSSDLDIKTLSSGDQLGNDSAILLSMSHSLEDPLCLKTGVRRVKVKEVRISENFSPEMVNSFCPQEKKEPRSENRMSCEHTYSTLHGSPLTVNSPFSKADNNMPYTGQAFTGGSYNITAMLNWYLKENGKFMSPWPTYNYCHGNFSTINPSFNGSYEASYPSMCNGKEVNAITPVMSSHGQPESAAISPRIIFRKENPSPLPMSDNYRNSEQTTIPFRGFHNNAGENDSSGGLISSCAVLQFQSSGALGKKDSVGHQSLNVISASTSKTDGAQKNKEQKATKTTPSNNFPGLISSCAVLQFQSSGALGKKDSVGHQSLNVISAFTSKTDGAQKNKEQKATKTTPSNNFPANVKRLLSTGILDGVPVKYVSWSREMTLRGVVNGTRYLCGCQECKLAKAVNAYKFESHAGCKTKHPNDHIYFENGKSIYAVAQELKNTPREMLFDAMENMTGSMVNQKNFEIWKASYKATARELQHIYLKADTVMPS